MDALKVAEGYQKEIKEFMKLWNILVMKYTLGEGQLSIQLIKLCQEFSDIYFDPHTSNIKAEMSRRAEMWLAHLITLYNSAKINAKDLHDL